MCILLGQLSERGKLRSLIFSEIIKVSLILFIAHA
jgi:hypothetical protein